MTSNPDPKDVQEATIDRIVLLMDRVDIAKWSNTSARSIRESIAAEIVSFAASRTTTLEKRVKELEVAHAGAMAVIDANSILRRASECAHNLNEETLRADRAESSLASDRAEIKRLKAATNE